MEYYWLDYYKSKFLIDLKEKLMEDTCSYLKYEIDSSQRRQILSKDKIEVVVSCFISNTLRALNKSFTEISVSLDEGVFTRRVNGRHNSKVSYNYTRAMLDMLKGKGYIELEIGGIQSWKLDKGGKFIPDETTNSKILLQPKILELFNPFLKYERIWTLDNVLILRDENGKEKDYRQSQNVKDMIKVLNITNKVLSKATITVDGQETSEIQLRRIFNNSFDSGGRFYTMHGLLQCNSQEERFLIKINDEDTVELDYKALHPNIAYAKLGIDLPQDYDPYYIDNWEKFGDNPEVVRKAAKMTLLIAINCDERHSAAKAVSKEMRGTTDETNLFKQLHEDFNVYELLDTLSEKHYRIADQIIYGGFGPQFQYDDSMISEYILNYFNKQGEVVIGIHDSYIVRESLEEELNKVMHEAFVHVLGSSSNCSVEKK